MGRSRTKRQAILAAFNKHRGWTNEQIADHTGASKGYVDKVLAGKRSSGRAPRPVDAPISLPEPPPVTKPVERAPDKKSRRKSRASVPLSVGGIAAGAVVLVLGLWLALLWLTILAIFLILMFLALSFLAMGRGGSNGEDPGGLPEERT